MQKHTKFLSILLAVSILAYSLFVLTVPAYAASAKLTVVVKDCETKKPIAEAVVTITTADGAPSRKTNANGQVVFKDIKPVDQNHTVKVEATGFPTTTAVKYLEDGESGGLSFCLRKAPVATSTPLPTATPLPLPTQPPAPTPEAQPTAAAQPTTEAQTGGDAPPAQAAVSVAQCPAVLTQIFSQQFGAGDGAALVPSQLAQGACQNDANPLCARDQIFKPVFANAGAFLVKQNIPQAQAAQTAWTLVNNPDGLAACGAAPAYALALAQQFSVAGLRLDYIGMQTSARPLVTNAAGQRAGMLEDGSVVEEIPGSKAGTLGDRTHIFVPAGNLDNVTLQGVSDGTLTVDVVRTVGDGPGAYVDGASFENLAVSPTWKANLDVSAGEPELNVVSSDGQSQLIASSWIERNAVDAAGLAYWTGASAAPTASSGEGAQATPAAAATDSGFNLRANIVPVLLIGGGIGFLMVLITLAVVYFFFIRKRNQDDDEEE